MNNRTFSSTKIVADKEPCFNGSKSNDPALSDETVNVLALMIVEIERIAGTTRSGNSD